MLAGKVVLIDWKRWRVISLVKTCSYHSYWRSLHSECNCRSQKFVPIKKVQELKISINLNAWLLFTHLTEGYFCNILFWLGVDAFHFRTAVCRVRHWALSTPAFMLWIDLLPLFLLFNIDCAALRAWSRVTNSSHPPPRTNRGSRHKCVIWNSKLMIITWTMN